MMERVTTSISTPLCLWQLLGLSGLLGHRRGRSKFHKGTTSTAYVGMIVGGNEVRGHP